MLFTGGGTESDNLAVKGLYWAAAPRTRAASGSSPSAVEHHAVMDPALWLAEHEGADGRVAAGRRSGRVAPESLEAAIADDPGSVALVTVMWANNEVGTVQPIADLAAHRPAHGIPHPLRRGAGLRRPAGRLRGLAGSTR